MGAEEQDKPHLEIFGAPGSGQHTAVIVCPGGGYTHLAYDKEGTRIAEWLNLRGITAFVLTYRLAPRYRYPAPILDGYRAMRWVRSHAQAFAIAPDRIGMWGFSAGGHLVGIVGTHFDEGNLQAADPIERVSDRPDFVISSYGGLTLQEGVAKPGAMSSLLGDHPSAELTDDMSPDKHVTAHTPPYFSMRPRWISPFRRSAVWCSIQLWFVREFPRRFTSLSRDRTERHWRKTILRCPHGRGYLRTGCG